MIWQIVSATLTLLVLILFIKLFVTLYSINEIEKGIDEFLNMDTNLQITVSSGDPRIKKLASTLNKQLQKFRKERIALEKGNSELQTAITNIAHDLRTPLTAINGYLELLDNEKPSGKQGEYIDIIHERADRLTELTEELFKYSVISVSSDDLHPEPAILNDELEKALAAAYQVLITSGITPTISISKHPTVKDLDKNAVQRIFGNILNNASKYSNDTLIVELDDKGVITFSNPAPKLSNIDVAKLFDRFYTVENGKHSTGLGLSIAKTLTEKMGGSINAEYSDGMFVIRLLF